MILSLRAFEKVKLHKPRTLSRWLSRESQTCSKASSDPLATRKRFIAINTGIISSNDGCDKNIAQITPIISQASTELTLNYCRWAQKRRDDD